jgi:hypothetical protein
MSRDLFVVSINVSHADQAAHRASGRAGGSARHVASAPAGPASHTGSRRGEPTWAVILRGQRYDVTDEGKGFLRIVRGGVPVWSGKRDGESYQTHGTLLAPKLLATLLKMVRDGDSHTPKAHVGSSGLPVPASASAVPPSGVRTSQRAPEAAKPARASAPGKPASDKPASGRRASSKRQVSQAQLDALARGRAKRAANRAAAAARATPAAATPGAPTPHAKRKPAAAPPASSKKKPAPPPPSSKRKTPPSGTRKAEAGPPTSRSPGSIAKPESIKDNVVLGQILEHLRRESPADAEKSHAKLSRIWLGGGREATIAWMQGRKFPSVVAAFNDWVEKNIEAAQTILRKAAKERAA